ncbi:MAG: lamin tail domain-containing protein, partial [Verrucomicrobia bacterium]|nr:lamin tail domain-containing protein [Verrucomicrobiota bacterium]
NGRPYTRDADWLAQNEWMVHTFFPQRSFITLQQLIKAGLYPPVAAPKIERRVVGPVDSAIEMRPGVLGQNGPELRSNTLQGLPVVRFDGNDSLTSASSLQLFPTRSSPLTVLVLFRSDNIEGQKFLLNHGAGVGVNFELGYDTGNGSGSGNFGVHRGSGSASVAPEGTIQNHEFTLMTIEARSSGVAPTNLVFRKNGVLLTAARQGSGWLAPPSYNTAHRPLNIGARDDSGIGSLGSYHVGDIAELVILRQELSTEDRASLERYLTQKYGLPATPGPTLAPDAFQELYVWLSADTGIKASEGTIVEWQDRSTNGFLFMSNPPRLPATAPEYQLTAANGQPSARFDGLTDVLISHRPIQLFETTNSGLTVFTVFSTRSASSPRFLASHAVGINANWELGYDVGASAGVGNLGVSRGGQNAVVAPQQTITSNQLQIVTAQTLPIGVAPNNVRLWKNGIPLNLSIDGSGWLEVGAYRTNHHRMSLGARLAGGSGQINGYHDGDLAEFLVFRRDLDQSERAGIERYLADKYGLDVPPGSSRSPETTANLELWLRADRGINGPASRITRWEDQSGRGHVFVADTNAPVLPDGIYFTLDGSDPLSAGGVLSAHAQRYDQSFLIRSDAALLARELRDGAWSAPTRSEASTDQALPQQAVRITELMYHPAPAPLGSPYGDTDFEFIELKNVSDRCVDLNGLRLTGGVEFAFEGAHGLLAPRSAIVIVNNLHAFASRYPSRGIRVAGEFAGNLSNGGERLLLENIQGKIILDFSYADDWVPSSDGAGFSLTVINDGEPSMAWSNRTAWRSSLTANGSPGRDDTPELVDTDGDGLPDTWETTHKLDFRNSTDAASDADQDGMSAIDEYRAGLDPNESQSVLAFDLVGQTAVGIELSFRTQPNRGYRVDWTESIQQPVWRELESICGTPAERIAIVLDQSARDRARFYRLAIP